MSVIITVDQDGWTGRLQMSIGDEHGGYRLAGPKYNGSSTRLLAVPVRGIDAAEIRRYLDQADEAEVTTATGG